MSVANKFPQTKASTVNPPVAALWRMPRVTITRDFAMLVGLCLATGVAVGLSMMLAVLLLV